MKMGSRMKNLVSIIIISITLAVLSACGNLGTAVVLWPPENSRWEPGDMVTVKDKSILRSTYIVNLPGQRRLKEEIDQWRLRLYSREKNAIEFAANMGEWRNVYAECLYQGLPMRSEPSNTASRLYRFRESDTMKVINRNPGPVQVGNLEGYWYQVIADGGVEGYVFDYYLRVMEIKDGESEILNARNTDDPILDNLLSDPWRPRIFGDMIADRQIDLTIFRPEYGLFPDFENKTLTLQLPDISFTETWSEIVPAGPDRYDFLGTSFRVTVNSEYFISVQYNIEGSEHYEAFVRLSHSINDTIAFELNRREAVLEQLLEMGPIYGSRAYGELVILEEGNFTWSGKSSLISRGILSSSAGNTGRLEFDHFADPIIATSHEGVLSLRFDNGEAVRFLYGFEDNGLRLLHVPGNAIDEQIVKTDQYIDPIRLFFVPLAPAENDEGIALPDR
jgi:hypothetical protein